MKALFWTAVAWTTASAWVGLFTGEYHLSMWKFLAAVFMGLEELKSRKLEESVEVLWWIYDTLKDANEDKA